MNEVINNILTRRSIRDFSDEPVSKDNLEILIETAIYAPSGQNRQTWKFFAVTNKEIIDNLALTIGEVLGRQNYHFFNAQALIIPSNEIGSRLGRDDNACALQNIFLAGHSLNIGSVWINQLLDICDDPKIRPILDQIGIPENHEVYGFAALGYSKSEPSGKTEKRGTFTIVE